MKFLNSFVHIVLFVFIVIDSWIHTILLVHYRLLCLLIVLCTLSWQLAFSGLITLYNMMCFMANIHLHVFIHKRLLRIISKVSILFLLLVGWWTIRLSRSDWHLTVLWSYYPQFSFRTLITNVDLSSCLEAFNGLWGSKLEDVAWLKDEVLLIQFWQALFRRKKRTTFLI